MAKSNAQKLQEALEKGDLEAAKVLAAKLTPAPKKKATTKKSAARPRRQKPAEPALPPGVSHQPPSYGGHVLDSSWMAPASRPAVYTGDDGVVHREARRIPANQDTTPQRFLDPGGDVPDGVKKYTKNARKASQVGRRSQAQRVRVRCAGACGRDYDVYPSEMAVSYDDSGRAEPIYKCNRCSRRGS